MKHDESNESKRGRAFGAHLADEGEAGQLDPNFYGVFAVNGWLGAGCRRVPARRPNGSGRWPW